MSLLRSAPYLVVLVPLIVAAALAAGIRAPP